MFQAIKINNYQNLLATKNNRKVTFIINQFQVSICSSPFSPCISPDKTLRIVLSLSINIVFCISPATCFANLFLFKTFDNSTITLFIPPPNALIINSITVILYPGLLSLNSYANYVYFVSFSNRFASMFCCWGQVISQFQIFFDSLSSKIKSGLLDVFVFGRLNSKSHNSLALPFSSTVPRSHLSLYHTVSSPISSYSLPMQLPKSSVHGCVLSDTHYSLILCNQQLGAPPSRRD